MSDDVVRSPAASGVAGEAAASGPVCRHTSAQFQGAGGVRLHLQAWLPAGEPAAVLAVVHGYGEHGGRHDRLAEAMTARGYAVYVYDLRGHGLSSGVRGQVGHFSDYLDDTAVYLDEVRALEPGRTVFLLGHSLGGLIAAGFAADHPQGLRGLILSSPFLRLGFEVPATRRFGARMLSVVWPGRDIGNTLRAEELSHEADVVEAYTTDPLVHHRAPARWAAETLAAQDAILGAAPRLDLPLLLLYGDGDVVADPVAGREFFEAAGSTDKTARGYEGFYHELFNETGREQVFADLAEWLGAHPAETAAPSGPGLTTPSGPGLIAAPPGPD